MKIHATMIDKPVFERKEDGKRYTTDKKGLFTILTRLPKAVWQIAKPYSHYMSEEEVEDQGGISGWSYSVLALSHLIKDGGNEVVLDNRAICTSGKELWDACEALPVIYADEAVKREEKQHDLEREKAELITRMKREPVLDWSWDDFRFSKGQALQSTKHYLAVEYLQNNIVVGWILEEKK